jgi:ABC-type phosphate transport system substrate-binding protein
LPILAAVALLVLQERRSAAAETFQVIVNASNPASSLSVQELSMLFMKKTSRWPDGVEAAPVDLREQSEVRESFSRLIHGKSTAAVKAYWQKMIFSGREVPPPERATGAEVVGFVRANRGAVGYVGADTALGGGVKVLRVVP